MITYKTGDLFLSGGDILVHSCNNYGVWGAGIAKEFHRRYPKAFEQYHNRYSFVGDGFLVEDKGQKIGCLIVSDGYGRLAKDSQLIANHTFYAIKDLLRNINQDKIDIHSPRINAGLFPNTLELNRGFDY